jgi:hypothetical protein
LRSIRSRWAVSTCARSDGQLAVPAWNSTPLLGGLLQLSPVTEHLAEAQEWFDVLPEAMGIGLVVKSAAARMWAVVVGG